MRTRPKKLRTRPKSLTWSRIGWWKDGEHTRFRLPLVGRGALGESGHAHVLGIRVAWYRNAPRGWSTKTSVSLWGLVAFVYEDTDGGKLRAVNPGLRINFFTVSRPIFRRAKEY